MPDGAPLTDAETDHDPFPRPPQAWREEGHGRRSAPDDVWAAARDDYLAGLSAPEVCARHDLRLTTLRNRAAREGWRRIDQPWAPRNRLDPDDEGVELEARVGGDLNKVEWRELSWVAVQRMMRAVMRGDAAGALRWRRVRDAMEAEDAEMERAMAQAEAIRTARLGYGPRDALAPDAGDGAGAGADDRDGWDGWNARDGVFAATAVQARNAAVATDGVSRAADDPAGTHFPDPASRDTFDP